MFGSGKAKELQTQLTALRSKLENANKEKTSCTNIKIWNNKKKLSSCEKLKKYHEKNIFFQPLSRVVHKWWTNRAQQMV